MAAWTSVDDCGGSITRARRANVRFTPKSGQTQAAGFVRFVPKADICNAANSFAIQSPRRHARAGGRNFQAESRGRGTDACLRMAEWKVHRITTPVSVLSKFSHVNTAL